MNNITTSILTSHLLSDLPSLFAMMSNRRGLLQEESIIELELNLEEDEESADKIEEITYHIDANQKYFISRDEG